LNQRLRSLQDLPEQIICRFREESTRPNVVPLQRVNTCHAPPQFAPCPQKLSGESSTGSANPCKISCFVMFVVKHGTTATDDFLAKNSLSHVSLYVLEARRKKRRVRIRRMTHSAFIHDSHRIRKSLSRARVPRRLFVYLSCARPSALSSCSIRCAKTGLQQRLVCRTASSQIGISIGFLSRRLSTRLRSSKFSPKEPHYGR
jgi:hypothetical protein